MNLSTVMLPLITFIFVVLIICTDSIPVNELVALQDLYDATNGTHWKWTDDMIKWNFSQPNANPCLEKWQGIHCVNISETSYFIDEIILQSMGLSGVLPPSIGNFSMLTQLRLDYNSLISSLPHQLGQLTLLEGLSFSLNSMNGTIPSSLGSCVHLNTFDLFLNAFSGSIPDSFVNLNEMYDFQVHNNFLTGNIDFSSSWTTNLTYFVVSVNHFNATIPDNFCYAPKLTELGLENNYFRGTIPSCWNSQSILFVVTMQNNDLTGTLPSEFSNLPYLFALALGSNNLHGRIPEAFTQMNKLPQLLLGDNLLTGPILNISSMIHLTTLDLSNNLFTGWMPQDMGRMNKLTQIILSSNHLSGPIPDLSNCSQLHFLQIQDNHITSSLPDTLSALTKMYVFQAYGNELTGSLPASLDKMRKMNELDLSDNQLTGPIFEGIGNIYVLSQCMLQNNLLTGPIPPSMSDLTSVVIVQLNNNLLSGSIPSLHGQLSVEQVFLYSNLLSGSMTHVFNCTTNWQLMYVDVSNNELSHHLPSSLFSCPMLKSFSALGNCFSGPLPTEMCGATNLTSLVLDGLMSATSCQKRFFKNFEAVVSYGLSSRIPDGIPECLFSLPLLETLHLSGNGLTGTLPRDLLLSASLSDLSLSHNSLRGDIPPSLRFQRWSHLDLSYNKITGTFEETPWHIGYAGFMLDNASLSLKVNRLSGKIPPALKHLDSVSILDGNIFQCDASRSSLPPEDPDYEIYSCGSNSFNNSIYVWCAVMSCVILVTLVLWMLKLKGLSDVTLEGSSVSGSVGQLFRKLSLWMSVFTNSASMDSQSSLHHIRSFGVFVSGVRKVFGWLTLFIVVILLPTYLALSEYYDTYTHEYAWSVSGAYLSGVTPSVLLFFLLLLFGACCIALLYLYCRRVVYGYAPSTNVDVSNKKWLNSAALLAVVVWNMILVTGVNIAYVYIDRNYSSAIVQTTQLFVALFKVTWNNLIVQYVLKKQNKDHKYDSELERLSMTEEELRQQSTEQRQLSINVRNTDDAVVMPTMPPPTDGSAAFTRGISLAVFVMLFNNIAAPFIATGYVSSNCFYDIVTSPQKVEVTYEYAQCSSFQPHGNVTLCLRYDDLGTNTLGYYPPYLYSYQCASTFITTYANIFILMLTIDSFIIPLLLWLTKFSYDRLSRSSHDSDSLMLPALERLLSPLLKPVDVIEVSDKLKMFRCDVFIVKLVNMFGILCTFGVILPPVAVICCIAVLCVTYHAQVLMGRFVHITKPEAASDSGIINFKVKSHDELRSVLEKDCEGAVNMFLSGVHMIVPFAAIFFGLVLFDTLGDAVGWKRALVVPLLVCILPLMVYLRRSITTDITKKCFGSRRLKKRLVIKQEDGTTYSIAHQPNNPQHVPLLDEASDGI